MELQLRDTEELNLTLYGLSNNSFLQPHPPGEEGEEEVDGAGEKRAKGNDGHGEAFYCCRKTSDPGAPSQCLLWLANQTVMTATQRPPAAVAPRGRCQDGGAAPCVAWPEYKLARRARRRQTKSSKKREQRITFCSRSSLKVVELSQSLLYSEGKKKIHRQFLPTHSGTSPPFPSPPIQKSPRFTLAFFSNMALSLNSLKS